MKTALAVSVLVLFTPVQAEDSISVKVIGTIRTGVVAIGGETTGTTLTSNGITFELDFGKDTETRKAAEKLDGKRANVEGMLERRIGVEVKERWIVKVARLRVADGKQRRAQ